MPYFKVAAQYLEKYGDESPLFEGFNGGFYNFTCDSLQWRYKKPDSTAFHDMLRSLMDLVVISGERPVYYELMGDLLVHHPAPVTANWFSCLSYFRLAFALPDQQYAFEEKAIHALEAPLKRRDRFDNYQFNRLRQRMAEDLDSVAGLRAAYLERESAAVAEGKQAVAFLLGELAERQRGDGAVTWMHEGEEGALPGIVREADRRYAEKRGLERKFAGEVDLKRVKTEASFNYYGIAMILVVIGAVVLIWVRMSRGAKKED